MKKTIIWATILGILGSLGRVSPQVWAWNGEQSETKEEIASSETGVNITKWEESLTTEANVANQYLKFPSLYPLHNYLTVELIPSETRALKRLIIVYYDYEAGVTEEEADLGLATLGEDEAEWAVILLDEEYEFGMETNPLLNVSGFDVQIEGEFIENKRDLLYYAAEFGEPELLADGTTSWKNTVWTRGKYDYRSCIHGEDFDPNLPNYVGIPTCFAREDGEGGIIVTATYGGETSEHILTWEEEWREIQAERLNEIVFEIATWEDEWKEDAVRETLKRLQTLDVTLTVSDGVNDLLVVEQALTAQLEMWLKEKTEEVEGVKNETAKTHNDAEDNIQEVSEAESKVSTVTNETQAGSQTGAEVTLIDVADEYETEAVNMGETTQMGDEKYVETVEVPALGGDQNWYWWWIIIGVLLLSGGAVWWWKLKKDESN